MEDDQNVPSISLVVHDGGLNSTAVIKVIWNALNCCFPFVCNSPGLETNEDGKATASFVVRMDEPDGQERLITAEASTQRMAAHCDLLDALGVANGTKAIAIALHSKWTDLHRAKFGDPANPATVKRWRTAQRRGDAARRRATWTRRSSGSQQIVRNLRLHHARMVSESGCSVKKGYVQALNEAFIINEGGHSIYGRPNTPLQRFSYETFRKDCLSVRRQRRGPRLTPKGKR